jgi:hypothetical protein
MPSFAVNKDRSTSTNSRSSPNPGPSVRPNTRRSGPSAIVEEHQDVKDSLEGRKFLEKFTLLWPAGEPATHQSLHTCLHQISALAGVPKQAVNAIRSVAFLLEEMEDSQINNTLKEALDSQMVEFTSDFKLLIEDTKERFDEHVKSAEKRLANLVAQPAQPRPTTGSYASALINPPLHANPRVAAREGIKARQFMLMGLKETKYSHFDMTQLKVEINRLLPELGLPTGKVRSVVVSRNGGTVVEADSDEAAAWLSDSRNQVRLCEKMGPKAEFRSRNYNVIAFNAPTDINPEEENHRLEICEVNGLEPTTVTSVKWAKAVDKRSPSQRTAHLLLSFDDANSANRAITNGLLICNRKCQVERTRREPVRCLKCQGWNHFARDCIAEKDTCGNCAGSHRTNSCQVEGRACVSCKANDHASWSRACPTFAKKIAEFNVRNPDNALQFFPTADAWTWSMVDKPAAVTVRPPAQVQAPTTQAQARPSKTQLGKRPQRSKYQQCDTYMPTDTYIPDYSRHYTIPELDERDSWIDNPRALIPPVPPPAQSSRASSSTDSSHQNPTMSNA